MLRGLGADVDVRSDNDLMLDEVERYDKLVLSPGPGLPSETKTMMPILHHFANDKTILGICLGMQGIVIHYGGELCNMPSVDHGVSRIVHTRGETPLFNGLEKDFSVGLYHSWYADVSKAKELNVTSLSDKNIVMSVQHSSLPVFGLQFHPESIMTSNGKSILQNFLSF
jgi:anthranilate synthase component 2